MNAAVVEDFNSPPRYSSFKDPIPVSDELLVHVSAAGLHPLVKSLAAGSHYGSGTELPFVAGVDGTGTLDDGSRVYFQSSRPPFATMSELSITKKGRFVPIPKGLNEVTVAGLANPAMSSWVALHKRAGFSVGEGVLILGATGSAGKLALQIANRSGASRVIAVGRKIDAEASAVLGANISIELNDHRDEVIAQIRKQMDTFGVDIVLDYLWGEHAETVLEAISRKGLHQSAPRIRYVQIGSMAGREISLKSETLRSSGLELLGSGFGSASSEQIMQSLAEIFEEASKRPFITEITTEPLSNVEQVWTQPGNARVVFTIR